jgi:hypothetical protein
MEDHHCGGQGWNSAVEPEEEDTASIIRVMTVFRLSG